MKILSLCMRFALFLSCARDMIMDLVKQKVPLEMYREHNGEYGY